MKDNGHPSDARPSAPCSGHPPALKIRWVTVRGQKTHHHVVVADPKHTIAETNEKDNKRKRNLNIT